MSLESSSLPAPAHESGPIDLQQEATSARIGRARNETAHILSLLQSKADAALREVITDSGGMKMVWESLDHSEYTSPKECFRDLERSVIERHAKLAASENFADDDVNIGKRELAATMKTILNQCFANHGATMKTDLEYFRNHQKNTEEDA